MFPENYKPKPTKKKSPANQLTSDIIKLVRLKGGAAYRINSQGQYDEKLGKWRNSGMKAGLPDIMVCYQGQFIGIEVKIGRDKQSAIQQVRQIEIEASKGKYYIVKNLQDFINIIETW